jgi:hypothetical protein
MTIPDPPTVQVDSWALLDPRLLLPASPPGACLDADDVPSLTRPDQDIFHPPRFTSIG